MGAVFSPSISRQDACFCYSPRPFPCYKLPRERFSPSARLARCPEPRRRSLTEPTAAVQPRRLELVFMPHTRRSRCAWRSAQWVETGPSPTRVGSTGLRRERSIGVSMVKGRAHPKPGRPIERARCVDGEHLASLALREGGQQHPDCFLRDRSSARMISALPCRFYRHDLSCRRIQQGM